LSVTPREIERDKVSDYTYQEYQLSVRALIKLSLEVRDMLTKQPLGSEAIEVGDQKTQLEIAGVRDKDINHLANRQARLPSADQLLRECERKALEQLDEKLRTMALQYLQRFYNEGERALREGRNEDGLENFLCHWYSFRGGLDARQAQRIRDLIRFATGFELSPTGPLPAGL